MNNHLLTSSSAMNEAIHYWHYVEPFAKVPDTQKEYQRQQRLLQELMMRKNDDHVVTLLQLVARNLEIYENEHFPLKKAASSIEVLQYLMEDHDLTQADLPEIGSQSLVSKILQGKRKLTAEQIARLSHRFHVSPAVFY